MIRIGRVVRVAEAGVYVDIGGVEGLLRTGDVAWKDPEGAKAKIGRGEKLRVRVLQIEGPEVSLGMKQLTPHPGEALRKRYPLKSTVKGKVKGDTARRGALRDLEDRHGVLPGLRAPDRGHRALPREMGERPPASPALAQAGRGSVTGHRHRHTQRHVPR